MLVSSPQSSAAPCAVHPAVLSAGESASLYGDAGLSSVIAWKFSRNCALRPGQLLASFGVLCAVSMSVAVFFWFHGVRMVMPFACLEQLAVGVALWWYARHAGDVERIDLKGGRLIVQSCEGGQWTHLACEAHWVQVEAAPDGRSLIELRGRGQQVQVGRWMRPEARRRWLSELRRALASSQAVHSAAV